MPNYKLSPSVIQGMLYVCTSLCQRRINVAQTGFPLTREDLELAAIGPELIAKFEDIASYGVATFHKTKQLKFTVPAKLVGLERVAMLEVVTTEGSYYRCYDQISTGQWELPLDYLDDEKKQSLAKWVNNLVRETRMLAVTKKVVKWFLDGGSDLGQRHWLNVEFITAYHIMANWPQLAMLVDGKPGERSYSTQVDYAWKTRFRAAPDNLDRWRTSDPEFKKRLSAIKLANMFLTSADMLPTEVPSAQVTAKLNAWVRLPGDPD